METVVTLRQDQQRVLKKIIADYGRISKAPQDLQNQYNSLSERYQYRFERLCAEALGVVQDEHRGKAAAT